METYEDALQMAVTNLRPEIRVSIFHMLVDALREAEKSLEVAQEECVSVDDIEDGLVAVRTALRIVEREEK